MSTMLSDEAREEWQVLQSIYPEFVPIEQPYHDVPFTLRVPVQLSEPLLIRIVSEANPGDSQTITLSHLPPISLDVILPPSYPYEQSPQINSLQSSLAWLPPPLVEHLTQILLDMWANECVLGAWIEHIQNGDQLLSSLHILHPPPTPVSLLNSSPPQLSPLLATYNTSVLQTRFKAATHTCPICLSRLLGIHCITLSPCSHVACRSCLREFWGRCIAEGDVKHVGCPDPECVKLAMQASIADVKAVVTADEVDRWQWLLSKQEIERDPAITHCPILSCQRPVRPPPLAASDQPSEYDRLRICDCGFSFCVFCRRAWHGPLNPCSAATDDIIKSYLQSPEGSKERKALESKYGRNVVLRTITKFEEDQANRKWMDKETITCPGCHVRVQKNMGCNHMVCTKCHQHFCYRCGKKLEGANPYAHFSKRGQSCYAKLFDPELQNDDHWVVIEDVV